jgi:hypothetical protein
MNADMHASQPACRLEVGHARAQAFPDGRRSHFGLCFEPRHSVLRADEGRQQRMIVIGLPQTESQSTGLPVGI